MSIEAACNYASELVDMESRGRHGDTEGAMHRLEQRYGIGFWQLSYLRAGRAKSCDVSLFARLRAAYQAAALAEKVARRKEVLALPSLTAIRGALK